jgi:hypothetical protein
MIQILHFKWELKEGICGRPGAWSMCLSPAPNDKSTVYGKQETNEVVYLAVIHLLNDFIGRAGKWNVCMYMVPNGRETLPTRCAHMRPARTRSNL